jgi:hypothetical protein
MIIIEYSDIINIRKTAISIIVENYGINLRNTACKLEKVFRFVAYNLYEFKL